GGRVVAYCACNANGRASYPWALPGAEAAQEALFAAALPAVRRRGVTRSFAAYRNDWPAVNEFLAKHGFTRVREMVNYIVHFVDMPTPAARTANTISPLRPDDVPALLALAPEVLRIKEPNALRDYLFKN